MLPLGVKVAVSIIVPVKNEACDLPRALASVAWADEIWVVDSASTDGTAEVVRACGAQLVQFPFNGVWPKKKNWALDNLPFRHEWVFILDADEVLPPQAEAEFRRVIGATDDVAGYWIDRRLWFMGRWLRHAYRPNWNLRLFRHRVGRYERLAQGPTESGDNEVHEHVLVQGRTARLTSVMDHFAFASIHEFVEKHNRYSNWEARVELEAAQSPLPQHGRVGLRRRLRTLSRALPFRPSLRFCYVYFWQRGFLDGAPGFYFARLHAFYELLAVAKARELRMAMAAPAGR